MKKFYYTEVIEADAPWLYGPFDTLEEAKQAFDLPAQALDAFEDGGWTIEGNGAKFFSVNLENGLLKEEESYYFEARNPDIERGSYADIGFSLPEKGEE